MNENLIFLDSQIISEFGMYLCKVYFKVTS